MSIITPSEKSQEAMQAKTQAIPPRVREEVSPLPSGGTAGQVLTVNSDASGVEWANPSADIYHLVLGIASGSMPAKGISGYSIDISNISLYKNGTLVSTEREEVAAVINTMKKGTVIGCDFFTGHGTATITIDPGNSSKRMISVVAYLYGDLFMCNWSTSSRAYQYVYHL